MKGDPARDLATIHHLCEANLHDLQTVAKSQVNARFLATLRFALFLNVIFFSRQPSIKTLVTVTEMLTKHKQKYTEMINSASSAGGGQQQQH